MNVVAAAAAATLSFLPTISALPHQNNTRSTCRYLPGDNAWPSTAQWNALNRTIGGKLIRGVPLGQPCFAPHYDPVACANVQAHWTNGDIL